MKRTATHFSLIDNQSRTIDPLTEQRKYRNVTSPRESVIRNLLNYSKALAVIPTAETGYINLVMN